MAKREVHILDQATVSIPEAQVFFNMGRRKFTNRWDDYYRHVIDNVETARGLRLLLVDVVQAAFPGASEQTVTYIAYDYLLRLKDRRVASKVKGHRDRETQQDGGQDK